MRTGSADWRRSGGPGASAAELGDAAGEETAHGSSASAGRGLLRLCGVVGVVG
jgi:hypothetical protein